MNNAPIQHRRVACVVVAVVVATQTIPAWSQQAPSGTSGSGRTAATTAPTTARATFKQEELEQVLAPLALYPDSLLSQILMASTYPVEVVQAERWTKQNKSLKGDALGKALATQTWDPSVKSLINFPEVLTMMSEKLDWTVKLGDAFIAQQKEVMDTVQKLRAKAQAQGNLKSNDQQKVTVAPVSATQATSTTTSQVITIESANPQVVYVPTYDPSVVYGTWAYPSYPPYYYYPPNYYPGRAAVAFGVGVAIGAAWGYAWGGCNWGHGDVDIDVDRNINIDNVNIDREKARAQYNQNRTGTGARDRSTWQHDASHRQGVAYRDQGTAQRFGGASSNQAVQARDAYRGRAEAGRQDIARGGADAYRSGAGVSNRSSYGGSGSSARGDYRAPSSYERASQSGTRSGAFNDAGSSGSATRSYSNRGQTSRSSSGGYSGGGSRSAPARSGGGGGARGGGGGRR